MPKEVIKGVFNSLRQVAEGSTNINNLILQSFYAILEGMLGSKKFDSVLFNINLNYLLERKGLSLTQLMRLKNAMNVAKVWSLMEDKSLQDLNAQIETSLQQAASEDIKSLQQLIRETTDQDLLKQVITSKNNRLADLKGVARDRLLDSVTAENALEIFNLIITDASSTQLRKWIDKAGTAAAIQAYDNAIKNNKGEAFIKELFQATIDSPEGLRLLEPLFKAYPALLDRLIGEVEEKNHAAARNIFNVILPRASEVQLRTWMQRAGADVALEMYDIAEKQNKGELFFRNLVQVIIEKNWDPKKFEKLLKRSQFSKILAASIAESNNVAFLQKIIPMLPVGTERQTVAINRLISITTVDNAVANFTIIIEQNPSVEQISALVLRSGAADIGKLYNKAEAQDQVKNFISALVRISIENPKIDAEKKFFGIFQQSPDELVADIESLNADYVSRAHNLLTKLAQSKAMPDSVKAAARAALIASATPENAAEIFSLIITDASDKELEELAKKATVDNVQIMYKAALANSRVFDFISALLKTVENNNLDLGIYAKFFEAYPLAKVELGNYLASPKASLSFLKKLIASVDQTYALAKSAAIDGLIEKTSAVNVVENFGIIIPGATQPQIRGLLNKAGMLNGATIERLYEATPNNKKAEFTDVLAEKAHQEKWPFKKFAEIKNQELRIILLGKAGKPDFTSIEEHFQWLEGLGDMKTLSDNDKAALTMQQLEMLDEIATRFRDLKANNLIRLKTAASALEKQIDLVKNNLEALQASFAMLAKVQAAIIEQENHLKPWYNSFGVFWHTVTRWFSSFNLDKAAQDKERGLLQEFKAKLSKLSQKQEVVTIIGMIDSELKRLSDLQATKKSEEKKRAA